MKGKSDADADARADALKRAREILNESGATFPDKEAEAEALAALAIAFLGDKSAVKRSKADAMVDQAYHQTEFLMAKPENAWVGALVRAAYPQAAASVQSEWRSDARLAKVLKEKGNNNDNSR